jgi:hypothetical protein
MIRRLELAVHLNIVNNNIFKPYNYKNENNENSDPISLNF